MGNRKTIYILCLILILSVSSCSGDPDVDEAPPIDYSRIMYHKTP